MHGVPVLETCLSSLHQNRRRPDDLCVNRLAAAALDRDAFALAVSREAG
jgi:hypothetical protein